MYLCLIFYRKTYFLLQAPIVRRVMFLVGSIWGLLGNSVLLPPFLPTVCFPWSCTWYFVITCPCWHPPGCSPTSVFSGHGSVPDLDCSVFLMRRFLRPASVLATFGLFHQMTLGPWVLRGCVGSSRLLWVIEPLPLLRGAKWKDLCHT